MRLPKYGVAFYKAHAWCTLHCKRVRTDNIVKVKRGPFGITYEYEMKEHRSWLEEVRFPHKMGKEYRCECICGAKQIFRTFKEKINDEPKNTNVFI